MTEEETATITRLAKALSGAQGKIEYYASLNRTPDTMVALELASTERDIAQQELMLARREILQRRAVAS